MQVFASDGICGIWWWLLTEFAKGCIGMWNQWLREGCYFDWSSRKVVREGRYLTVEIWFDCIVVRQTLIDASLK